NQLVELNENSLKGRSFLLGNKRAFSLCLPVSTQAAVAERHAHKWFGAHLYGLKFLEDQVVRVHGQETHVLSRPEQRGFTMGLTFARREYEVEGQSCSEEFFVPDGIPAIACQLDGPFEFSVEPELDIRRASILRHDIDTYLCQLLDHGMLISAAVPEGEYDDATESFRNSEAGAKRAFVAIEIVGDDGGCLLRPAGKHHRRKLYLQDRVRQRFILTTAPEQARHDHAPLWEESRASVYVPVELGFRDHGTIFYGFGDSAEEALEHLHTLRDNYASYRAQKLETARDLVEHAGFRTGADRIDVAHDQVLLRLMNGLVARQAPAADTVLEEPASMILAGNRYFHDVWKRDENIALGFLLSLGYYDVAREVIRDTWQFQDPETGRLPHRLKPGEKPVYHSSDGTLWALVRLHQYWRSTGDDGLLHDLLPLAEHFFERSFSRLRVGMLPSGRTSSPDYLWETWMDTEHTPRDGFPIEIQMLWIASLRSFLPLVRDESLAGRMRQAEIEAREALSRFSANGSLIDSLDEDLQARDLVTPNPYFCFGLGLDLGVPLERGMRDVGRQQLAGRQGIKTLAPRDWERVFPPELLSNPALVRGRGMRSLGKFNYHRGVEWNWLVQFFIRAELKYGSPDTAYRRYLRRQVEAALHTGGVGGISELFDLSGSRGPEFQAWSMAGFLEALHAFAGIEIDVPNRRIRVEPQLPHDWPALQVRAWYGNTPFDLRLDRSQDALSLTLDFPWGQPPDCLID
ncbi:MAG: amylo-alpha-1,6-glucosidase, partial [Chloroflexota bacterium]